MPVGLGGSHGLLADERQDNEYAVVTWATASFALVVRMAKLTGYFSAESNPVGPHV